jgi:PncC family amidohydrolase
MPGHDVLRYEAEVVARMTEAGLTLATAESTVGGMIGHLLTNVPGSSKVFIGGITAYHGAPKTALLGVDRETLRGHGSVSEQAVREMAQGARRAFGCDVAVAESGIAGPTGNPDRPGGLYYIGIAAEGYERVGRHQFDGDREETKAQASQEALRLVVDYLDSRREGVSEA